jgi:hypothetical protein
MSQDRIAGALLVTSGVVGMVLSLLLPRARQTELGAIELAFIACSYPAMAFKDEDPDAALRETLAGAAFLGCAWLGIARRSRRIVGAGLLSHAAWDVIHHGAHVGAEPPRWFPPGCAVADALLALPLLAR